MSHVPADANTTSLLLFAAAIASATSLSVRLYRSLHTLCRGITCDAYSRNVPHGLGDARVIARGGGLSDAA